MGPLMLTADRLHFDGLDQLEVMFDGFSPSCITVVIHRVTATNLALQLPTESRNSRHAAHTGESERMLPMRNIFPWIVLASAAACGDNIRPATQNIDAAVDVPIDMPVQCDPNQVLCEGDDVVTCDASGMESGRETCPLGCTDTPAPAHCVTPVISNVSDKPAANFTCEIDDAALTDLVVAAGATETIDTTDAMCDGVVTQQGNSTPKICVKRYKSVDVAATGTIAVTGPNALAIVATGTINIAGAIDISATAQTQRCGRRLRGQRRWRRRRDGAAWRRWRRLRHRGCRGRHEHDRRRRRCGRHDGRHAGADPAARRWQGRHGRHAGGGCCIGWRWRWRACSSARAPRSRSPIRPSSTPAAAVVKVATARCYSTVPPGGGGGGGAGGAVLIEAPAVTIAGGVFANGGGGGSGGQRSTGTLGNSGADGQRSGDPAAGGMAAFLNGSVGGNGGAGATAPTDGKFPTSCRRPPSPLAAAVARSAASGSTRAPARR